MKTTDVGKNLSLPVIICMLNTTSTVQYPGTLYILNMCILNEIKKEENKELKKLIKVDSRKYWLL